MQYVVFPNEFFRVELSFSNKTFHNEMFLHSRGFFSPQNAPSSNNPIYIIEFSFPNNIFFFFNSIALFS